MSDTNQEAIEDAVEQIGLSMAANACPLFYVGQNIYDTTESVWTVWNSRDSTEEMVKIEAGIDRGFAVVGWVPVGGAGVKRTFRLGNGRRCGHGGSFRRRRDRTYLMRRIVHFDNVFLSNR